MRLMELRKCLAGSQTVRGAALERPPFRALGRARMEPKDKAKYAIIGRRRVD
jgi:hypothetical protein